MKKFEMPVVVLNEMTMNESIAADCCYSIKTEGLVTTKSILSGGTIGDNVAYKMFSGILDLYGTIGNIPKYHYKFYTPNTTIDATSSAGYITTGGYTSANVAFLTVGQGYSVGTTEYDATLLTQLNTITSSGLIETVTVGNIKNGSYIASVGSCDHLGSCVFNQKIETSNQHIGATVKHLFGGTDWAQPHTAQQYNS